MVLTCSAYGCSNRANKTKNLHFHSFPLNNKSLLSEWLRVLKREGFTPTKYSKLCSEHFLDVDYLYQPGFKKVTLKPDAVPSIFNYPDRLKKKVNVRATKASRDGIVQPFSENNSTSSNVGEASSDYTTSHVLEDTKYCDIGVQTDAVLSAEEDFRKTINTLRLQLTRQKKQILSMRQTIKSLRTDLEQQTTLLDGFEGPLRDIMENEFKNRRKKDRRGRRYSEKIKELSLSLHYGSSSQYNSLRKIFTLPHPSTIALWTSTVDAEPGFLSEVLNILHTFQECDRDVNLVIDAMSIKKGIVWDADQKKFTGFVDYGNSNSSSAAGKNEATEALFFLLVSLNGAWKLPFGYFLINKISGAVQGELISSALVLAHKRGIRVRSICFDGAPSNLTTAKYLSRKESSIEEAEEFEAEFDAIDDHDEIEELDAISMPTEAEVLYDRNQIPNFFIHPESKEKVYIILDACHMIKLVRNALATYKTFRSEDGLIEWRFLANLYYLQEKLGLKFANKLSKTHISFYSSKMKVKYAVQALSSSVADAIEWLRSMGVKEFEGSEATTRFIRIIDEMFDFLNSRIPFAKGFKKPIFKSNLSYYKQKIDYWINYLTDLQDGNGIPILLTRRKCFVIGLRITLNSVHKVASDLLEQEYYKYILSYKFSQDHIELFFSLVRLRLGCNDNPTSLQLKYIVKKLLLRNCISLKSGNVQVLNDEQIGSIFNISRRKCRKKKQDLTTVLKDFDFEVPEDFSFAENEELLKDNILYYISGYIVLKLFNHVSCEKCRQAMKNTLPKDHTYSVNVKFVTESFLHFKNRGGLCLPSFSVFKIVKECEQVISYLFQCTDIKKIRSPAILYKVRNNLFSEDLCTGSTLFPNLNCSSKDSSVDHKLFLFNLICKRYMKIRFYSLEKVLNDHASTRNKMKKMTLFKHE